MLLRYCSRKTSPARDRNLWFGPAGGAFASRISAAHLNNIFLKGWAEDLSAIFAEADIFCLPSHEEPFGLILGEAMLAGLPVIATKTDGPVDILGQNGESPDATLAFGGCAGRSRKSGRAGKSDRRDGQNPGQAKKRAGRPTPYSCKL